MKASMNARHLFPRDKQLGLSSTMMMRHVCYALIPGALLQTLFFGLGTVVQMALAIVTALFCEYLVAWLRKRPVTPLEINTGLVTALLLAASIPASAPYWLIITAVSFGLLIGKHVFGGVGMNIFNPALVGFCAVYLSYSAQMNAWPLGEQHITLSNSLSLIFGNDSLNMNILADSLTGATQLASLKANGFAEHTTQTHWWINLAWLVGGIYLWVKNIADWRLSASFIVTFITLTLLLSVFHDSPISSLNHIGLGALIFTTCFIITDPTTAASSSLGRVIYAMLAAILAVIIRQYSNMPDSMAFAVLFANITAPMIDNYTRPQYVRTPRGK